MNTKYSSRLNWPGLLAGPALVTALLGSGCVYENPHHQTVYREPAPVVVMQDDYIYYPQYEVYYSNSRHQYGYRNGNSWDWRPAPPGVSLNALVSSPSVRMDFHDSPEHHHNTVVRTYPRNWKPEHGHADKDDHHDDKDNHHDDQGRHHDDDRQH